MPREHIILECTEARAEGKPVSRYMSTRDKKQQPDRVEKKKYNKFLRRHTLHPVSYTHLTLPTIYSV